MNAIIGIPVSYTCQFINLWTGVRHPTEYPSNAHWSPMLMASHKNKYTMFSQNSTKEASVGVQNVAEVRKAAYLYCYLGHTRISVI